ncbi:hypothetical protein BH20ACT7_BH20ACT7_16070 [soil metagenome]
MPGDHHGLVDTDRLARRRSAQRLSVGSHRVRRRGAHIQERGRRAHCTCGYRPRRCDVPRRLSTSSPTEVRCWVNTHGRDLSHVAGRLGLEPAPEGATNVVISADPWRVGVHRRAEITFDALDGLNRSSRTRVVRPPQRAAGPRVRRPAMGSRRSCRMMPGPATTPTRWATDCSESPLTCSARSGAHPAAGTLPLSVAQYRGCSCPCRPPAWRRTSAPQTSTSTCRFTCSTARPPTITGRSSTVCDPSRSSRCGRRSRGQVALARPLPRDATAGRAVVHHANQRRPARGAGTSWLCLKADAIMRRDKPKDAYDVVWLINALGPPSGRPHRNQHPPRPRVGACSGEAARTSHP